MRAVALFLLITAGCGLNDVPEADVGHLGGEPDATPVQVPLDPADLPDADAGIAAQGELDANTASLEPVTPSRASADDDADTSVIGPAVDAGLSPTVTSYESGLPPSVDERPQLRCLPGSYKGPFIGVSTTLLDETLSGTMTFELASVPGQDRLAAMGYLEGVSQRSGPIPAEVPVTAELRAILNCGTHQLEDGQLITTSGSTETIAGMLVGAYSDNPPSLSGTWNAGGLIFGASGTWSVLLAATTGSLPQL